MDNSQLRRRGPHAAAHATATPVGDYGGLSNEEESEGKRPTPHAVSPRPTSLCPVWLTVTISQLREYIASFLATLVQRRSVNQLPSPQTQGEIAVMLRHLSTLTVIPVGSCTKHDNWLMETWNAMRSPAAFVRISPQWGEVGFQGTDPATDFRGSGELGLRVLHYFCTKHTLEAKSVLANATRIDYPFACALIQMTFTILNMAKERPNSMGALLFAFRKRAELSSSLASASTVAITPSSSSSSSSSASCSPPISPSSASSSSSSSGLSSAGTASSSSPTEALTEDDKLRGFLSGLTQPSSLFPREVSNSASPNASLHQENKEDKKAVDSDDEDDPEEEMYVGALSEMVGVVFAQFDAFYGAARPENVMAFNPLCSKFFDQTFKQGTANSWRSLFGVDI